MGLRSLKQGGKFEVKQVLRYLILAEVLFLNSCGDVSPNLTSRDLTKLQRQESTELHTDELIPILGKYSGLPEEKKGLYLKREDRWVKFELFLTMHNVAVEDDASVDSIVLPQLSGSAKQWLDGGDTYIELEVESGSYNPKTRKIYLTFKNTSLSLEGFLGIDGIHANWNSSLRGDIAGEVHVEKN